MNSYLKKKTNGVEKFDRSQTRNSCWLCWPRPSVGRVRTLSRSMACIPYTHTLFARSHVTVPRVMLMNLSAWLYMAQIPTLPTLVAFTNLNYHKDNDQCLLAPSQVRQTWTDTTAHTVAPVPRCPKHLQTKHIPSPPPSYGRKGLWGTF